MVIWPYSTVVRFPTVNLLSVVEVLNIKSAYRKLYLVNLLVGLNFNMDAYFRVKEGSITFKGVNSLFISSRCLEC